MRIALAVLPATLALALGVAASPAAARTVVKTHHGSLGTYLVDRHGRTLYLFRKDRRGHSRCSGDCADFWPPLIAHGRPKARGHAKQSKLGTTRRSDGRRQVTYGGHPLYRYSLDSAAGDTNGEGVNTFGARWWVVSRWGHQLTGMSAPPNPYGY
jgi:predicted lipoprotein with Yx(FWY)xxD motif